MYTVETRLHNLHQRWFYIIRRDGSILPISPNPIYETEEEARGVGELISKQMAEETRTVSTRCIYGGVLYEVSAIIAVDRDNVDTYKVQRLPYLSHPLGPCQEVAKGRREAYQLEEGAWHLSSLESLIDAYHRENLIY